MTTIALFQLGGVPMLVGDIAISGDEGTETASLPTVGLLDKVFPMGSRFVIIGTAQKVAIATENLAVAWAGDEIVASTVLRELASIPKPTLRDIENCIRTQDERVTADELVLLGYVNDGGKVTPFRCDGRKFRTVAGPESAGSGAELFGEALAKALQVGQSKGTAPSVTAAATMFMQGVTGHLMMLEHSPSSYLLKYAGGGYEIAIWHEGRFQKVEDVVHVFFETEIKRHGDEVNLFSEAIRIIRPYYVEDVLAVRAASLSEGGKLTGWSLHFVEATHAERDSSEFTNILNAPLLPFDASVVCSHFMIVRERGREVATVFSRVDVGPNAPVVHEENGVLIEHRRIPSEHVEAIVRAAFPPR